MPIYEYRCEDCGSAFEKLRPMREAEAPTDCPRCGRVTKKQMSACCMTVSGGGGGACGPAGSRFT